MGALDELSIGRLRRASNASQESAPVLIQRLGLAHESAVVAAMCNLTGLPASPAGAITPDYPHRFDLGAEFLRRAKAIPIPTDGPEVVLAMANPFDEETAAAIAYQLNRPVRRVVAPLSAIESALTPSPVLNVVRNEESGQSHDNADVEALQDLASGAPVITLVNNLIESAANVGASDIHLEPTDDYLRVRLRIDGSLRDVERIPHSMKLAVLSRVKVLARLNIAETRVPQDGRIKASVKGREIDLRISTSPTIAGEGVVIRLLDRAGLALNFSDLGFSPAHQLTLRELLSAPHGLVLVTGPTGSGKTTTLYASLVELNDDRRKIFTVEDPVEYRLPGINQIQVNPKVGLSFAAALRSLLRQDPDILMVGEIRDRETAEIAVQAALTGHLVLATVHTNSAPATITRLLDMGLEDYLIAACLRGVVSQRLVGSPCECAASAPAPAALFERYCVDCPPGALVRQTRGCAKCGDTGYKGRKTIAEIMSMTPQLRAEIARRAPPDQIEDLLRREGMKSMAQDGLEKALSGGTTVEEVLRVAGAQS